MNPEYSAPINSDAEQVLKAVRIIAEKIRGASVGRVLQQLVEAIADVLHADAAFIGRIEGVPASMKTIAQVMDGKQSEPFEYLLSGTPCEKMLAAGICTGVDDLTDTFPEYPPLKRMTIKGYVGTPLQNSKGELSGALVVLFHSQPEKISAISDILSIFATRASAELEREDLDHQLSMSEERYRLFFEEDLTGDYLTTPDGRLLDANPAFLRIFGFDSLQQARETDMSCLYPEKVDRGRFLELLKKKRKLKGLEGRAVRMDGTPILIREKVTGHFDGQGNLTRIYGYAIDITGERATETELRGIREIIEESPAVAFVWRNDPDWPVEFVTDNVVLLCGYTATELMGGTKQYADIIHPDDRERVFEEVQRHSDDCECRSFSHERYRLVSKDGTITWVDDRTVIQRDETGDVLRFRAVVLDVTDQAKMEQELAQSRQRYRLLFESAPDAIFIADPGTGFIVDVNPAAERLLLLSREEIIGMHQSELHPKEPAARSRQDFQNHVNQASQSGTTSLLKQHVVRRDGSLVPVEVRADMVEIGGQKLLQGVFRDVSDREEAETALQESELKFRTLVEYSLTGVYIIQDDLIRYVNPRLADIFGFDSPDEMIEYGPIGDFIWPTYRKQVLEGVRRPVDDNRRGFQGHFKGRKKDGSPVYVEVHHVYSVYNGRPATMGTMVDASERILQEKELKKNRLRLITAQHAARLGFMEWDVQNSAVYLSNEIIEILGLDGEEGWQELNLVTHAVHPDYQELVGQRLVSALKGELPYQVDYKIIRPVDGKTIWVRGTGTIDRDKSGRAVRMIGSAQDISKEKEAEIQLRNSEEKFRVLAEHAPVAIMIYQEKRFVYANPGASIITGYSTEELCSMKWWDIIHPDYRETVRNRGSSRLKEKETVNRYEFKILRKDGEERWVDFTGNLIEFDGKPSGIIVAVDITERKAIELRLRRDEARLKVLFDQSPVSLWEEDFSEVKTRMDALRNEGIKDMGAYLHSNREVLQELVSSVKLTDVNQASLLLFHAPDKRHLQENLEKSIRHDAGEMWVEQLCAFYEGQLEYRGEGVARTLDGEEIFAHWRLSLPEAYRESWGKVLVSITDITERYRMEMQLKESESKFRVLFEQSPVAFKLEDFSAVKVEIDRLLQSSGMDILRGRLASDFTLLEELAGKVRVISMNESARNLLGISPDDTGHLSLVQQFTPISLEDFGRQLTALIDGGKMYAREGETRTAGGDLKYVLVQLGLLEAVAGTWDRVLVSIVDLTEKKNLELEQKRLEAQLRQAQKLETVGTLAGGIAHDFNNILTPILGYTELAKKKVGGKNPVADYLDHIETASTRARDLVKQMLAFSRQSEEEKVPLNLAPVVEEVVQLIRSSIPSTIEIKTAIEKDCGIVVADGTQIHQVVLNLCTNAAQAMPFGGTLTISLKKIEIGAKPEVKLAGLKPGPYLLLTVRDTGTGMDEETLQRVFDPFFTTKEVGKGTGLGLSMVHGVAASHGGCCTADTELGEGSTFCVYLPVIESDTMQPSAKTFRETEEVVKGIERVLIVDDDPDVLDLHKEVLLSNGYQVRTFSSSEAALIEVQTNPTDYDVIVTDLTMPGITGLQLAVSVYEVRSDLPVVLVTGYREELTSDIRARTGIRKVLMKPVNIQKLSEAVQEVLSSGLRPNVE